MEVELYDDFPIASGSADAALSPTLVGQKCGSWNNGLHMFSTLSVISDKVARDSRKLRLCLKSVDGLYAGKSGF